MSAETLSEFVDTNILVYAHDRSAGKKHAIARELIKRLWETRQGCLSVQVLQEFYVTITRKVAQPIKPEEAAELIRDLGYWRIYTPTIQDVLSAIDLQAEYRISFWDAMVVHSALCLGCSVIWSEDLSNGQAYRQVIVKNPFRV
jgi:predicted nucleic acid-binding protein